VGWDFRDPGQPVGTGHWGRFSHKMKVRDKIDEEVKKRGRKLHDV
jgi:hypothetical protein